MSSTSILRAALAAAAASIFAACSGPQSTGFVPSGSQTMSSHRVSQMSGSVSNPGAALPVASSTVGGGIVTKTPKR
jgi:hypothetical protein